MDPWLFGIYATNIHFTIRHCLGDRATPEIMNAWLHVISFILRNMLPEYFGDCSNFSRWYEGATNASPAMSDAHHAEIKVTQQVREMRSGQLSRAAASGVPSRGSRAPAFISKNEYSKPLPGLVVPTQVLSMEPVEGLAKGENSIRSCTTKESSPKTNEDVLLEASKSGSSVE